MINRKKILEELVEDIHFLESKLMIAGISQEEISITPSQGLILAFIYRNDLTNVKKIADSLNITSSAVTQITNVLVKKGYLIRKENSKDRRFISLSLSRKISAFFKKFYKINTNKRIEIFNTLNDKDLIQYVNINKKIIKNITN